MVMAETVAKHVCTQNFTLFAFWPMPLPQLGQYISDWRASNNLVDNVMGCKGRYEPKVLCEASRPGSWLADFMYTLVVMEEGVVKPGVKFCVVPNATYAWLRQELGQEHRIIARPTTLALCSSGSYGQRTKRNATTSLSLSHGACRHRPCFTAWIHNW